MYSFINRRGYHDAAYWILGTDYSKCLLSKPVLALSVLFQK